MIGVLSRVAPFDSFPEEYWMQALRNVSPKPKVLSFIAQIRAEGRSCIFISHELSHVYRIADRFALMEHGRITAVLEWAATSQEELLHRLMLQEGER